MDEPWLSVIIPVLNEQEQLQQLLPRLNREQQRAHFELILADGGSDDHSYQIAQEHGARWIACPEPGRAIQLNYAAQQARGGTFFFLYADCQPPKNFPAYIKQWLQQGGHSGSFRLQFDWSHWFLRFNAWFTRFPFFWLRFGDQGLFCRRSSFEQLGGYREDLRVMEDQDLARRLIQRGHFQVLPYSMLVSARRYRNNGPLYLQRVYFRIWWQYYRGYSQDQLEATYRKYIKDPRR